MLGSFAGDNCFAGQAVVGTHTVLWKIFCALGLHDRRMFLSVFSRDSRSVPQSVKCL